MLLRQTIITDTSGINSGFKNSIILYHATYNFEKKVKTVMVYNSTNIKKTNNSL